LCSRFGVNSVARLLASILLPGRTDPEGSFSNGFFCQSFPNQLPLS
jgi:hypothetical protein